MDGHTVQELQPKRATRLHAGYAALVVGLTAFLLLVLSFPAPTAGYRSRAVIDQSADTTDERAISWVQREIVQSEVDAIARSLAASRGLAGAGAHTYEAATCRTEQIAPGVVRVVIETFHRHAAEGLSLCQQIAGRIAARQENSRTVAQQDIESQRSDVDRRLALICESRGTLQDELDVLQRRYLVELSTAMQRLLASQNDNKAASPKAAGTRHSAELQAECQRLLAMRGDLAQSRTENHPEVQDLDSRILALKLRLERLSTVTHAAPAPEAGESQNASLLAQVNQVHAEFHRRSDELSQQIASTNQREQELLGEAARLAASLSANAVTTEIVEAPAVVERVAGKPSRSRLGLFGAAACLIAGLVYWALVHMANKQPFRSVEDVRLHLSAPVIALGNSSVNHGPYFLESALKRTVLASELLLLVLVIWIASVITASNDLAQRASADPLGVIAETWDRTQSLSILR